MKTKLLITAFLVQSWCWAQTLIFPVTNGGTKDQGGIFQYDYSSGNHKTVFFNHEIEKSDHNNTGSSARQSKGVYVASNNSIYYTFDSGGTHVFDADASGQIVKYNLDTEEFSVIRSFSLLNDDKGTHPTNGLVEYNGKLFGVCVGGGNNANGVIYYIDLSDDTYHIAHHFLLSTDGAGPSSALVLESNKLYGGTKSSTDGTGFTLYEFDPNNNNYTVLHNQIAWGALAPVNDVIFKSGLLYYCTNTFVGYYNFSNGQTSTIHTSTGINDVLGSSYRGLNFSSNTGKYYVTSVGGGSNGKGAILELNGSLPYLVNVHSFGANGIYPQQELVDLGNGSQLGVTLENSTNINGSIFQFTATNLEVPIFSFPNPNTDGYRIRGIPVLVNNVLYGFADEGGSNDTGIFYKYDLATTSYSKIMDLGSTIGRAPIGQITPTNNNDYIGLNARGGKSGYGVIFTTDLTNTTEVYDNINNSIIEKFETNLILYNGLYYGVGLAFNPDAIESFSVLFTYDPSNNTIASVAPLAPSGIPGVKLPGSISEGILLIEGDKLYGFTSSKIFEYNIGTASLTYPHTFNTSIDGSSTLKAEIREGIIYGVNFFNGPNGTGTVFKFDIGSTTFSVLENFTASTGKPINLGMAGNFLYGITSKGGANSVGTIFKYDLINDSYSTINS